MALNRQARVLTKTQIDVVFGFLNGTRDPIRNQLIFFLSVKAGLRAKEIACLTWEMVTDSMGEISHEILLYDSASKGKSGRAIPMNADLREALIAWRGRTVWLKPTGHVISTERAKHTSAQVIVNLFSRWYGLIGLQGCSSHSGRRTFITNAARKIPTVGGSLRDVQLLAGHVNIRTTQGYIEANPEAHRKVVELI